MIIETTVPLWNELEVAAIDAILRGDFVEAAPFLRSHGSTALDLLAMLAEQGCLTIVANRQQKTAQRQLEIGSFVALRETRGDGTESAISAATAHFEISEATARRAKREWKKLTSAPVKIT